MSEEVKEKAKNVVEVLVKTYFTEGYTGLKRTVQQENVFKKFYREVFLKLKEKENAAKKAGVVFHPSASHTCETIFKQILYNIKHFSHLMRNSAIVNSLYNTLALAVSCVPEYEEAMPVSPGTDPFFLMSSIGLRETDGEEFEEELDSLLSDITQFHQKRGFRTYYVSYAGAVIQFMEEYAKAATFSVNKDMFSQLLKRMEKTDTGFLPFLLFRSDVPLSEDSREREKEIKELTAFFHNLIFLAVAISLLSEKTVSEMEDKYAPFLQKFIRKISGKEFVFEKNVLYPESPIIPLFFTVLFGSFPGSIRRLDGEILELVKTPFGKSLLSFTARFYPSLLNEKTLASLVQNIEDNGKNIRTYLPVSLMKKIPRNVLSSAKNKARVLRSLIHNRSPVKKLPLDGDITDVLLELTPKSIVSFVDFALYSISDLSNISFDSERIEKIVNLHVVSTGDVSAKHRFELLKNLAGKSEDAIILTILRKTDEVIRKKIKEVNSRRQLKEIIKKVQSVVGSYNSFFRYLYWMSSCEEIRLPEKDEVLKGMIDLQKRTLLIDIYLDIRERLQENL